MQSSLSATCVEETTCSGTYALMTVNASLTEQAPYLLANQVVRDDTLEIVVKMGAVAGRLVTAITLNASEPLCNYPGLYWTKGVDVSETPCSDAFVSSIPWALASSACGLTSMMNATTVALFGLANVVYSDVLPPLDGLELPPRELSSVVQFVIEQPRSLDGLTASVNTFNDPMLLGAVTQQRYDVVANEATLTVLISLAAPLKTAGVVVHAAPSDIDATPVGIVDNTRCADNVTTPCQQAYTLTLEPTLCSLNGTFELQFDVVCQQSVAGTEQCPTGGATTTLSISVTLTSEDLCQLARQRLRVSGSLASYATIDESTFALGAAKTAFFQAQTQHYLLSVVSDDGFALASSTIRSVLLQLNTSGTPLLALFNSSAEVTSAPAFAYSSFAKAASGQTAHQHYFRFTPAPEAFGAVARNTPVNTNVVANVDLTFVNGARKRAVFALGDNGSVRLQYHESVQIIGDEPIATTTKTTTTTKTIDVATKSGATATVTQLMIEQAANGGAALQTSLAALTTMLMLAMMI